MVCHEGLDEYTYITSRLGLVVYVHSAMPEWQLFQIPWKRNILFFKLYLENALYKKKIKLTSGRIPSQFINITSKSIF